MIGHALTVAPTPRERAIWDRWIGIGFAIGSACFFVAAFPGFVRLVGAGPDGVVFFVGSIFFTLAAGLESRESTLRLGRWAREPSWWSAAIQFAGTLLFNLDTFDAMHTGLTAEQEDRLVFAPDVIGSICFLVSGVLALWAPGGHGMALVNLAGCVFFMVSAVVASAADWATAAGALCFLAGAVLLVSSSSHVTKEDSQ